MAIKPQSAFVGVKPENWPDWRWNRQVSRNMQLSQESNRFPGSLVQRMPFSSKFSPYRGVIRNKHERYCPDCMQKRHRTAASQFSVWVMIGWNYKSKLIFYSWTEGVDKEFKNGNVRTQKQHFGGHMTQERYRN